MIQCGKSKRAGTYPARLLYTGLYFRLLLAIADRLTTPDNIYILSAKHGLVRADEPILSYDLRLSDLPNDQIESWRASVAWDIKQKVREGVQPIYVTGEFYRRGLPGISVIPEGLGMGEQISYLKRILKRKGLL